MGNISKEHNIVHKGFYIDSCIYLNLWQKEEGNSAVPFWKSALDFLERCDEEGKIIYYSGYVLKELEFVLGKEVFMQKRSIFKTQQNMARLFATEEEVPIGRKLEAQFNFSISFFDIMHMVLAKRADAVLITRDRRLIHFAGIYRTTTKKPEQCLY